MDDITIFIEGGVIQDITGIPKTARVTVVDWDIEGTPEEDLTELEAGSAVVTEWNYRG